MKKGFSFLLAALLSVSVLLTGCGTPSQTASTEQSAQNTGAVTNAVSASELVYTAEILDVEGLPFYGNVTPLLRTEDGVYVAVEEAVGRREIPEGRREEYEGQYTIYAPILYLVTQDGKASRLPGFEPILPPDAPEASVDDFESYAMLNGLSLSPDGNLTAIYEMYSGWFDGADAFMDEDEKWDYYQMSFSYEMVTWRPDGTLVSHVPVRVEEDAFLDSSSPVFDPDGNLLVLVDGEVTAISPDGSPAYRISDEDSPDSLVTAFDGTVSAILSSWLKLVVRPLDFKEQGYREGFTLSWDIWGLLPGNAEYAYCAVSGSSLYGLNPGEEPVPLLKWTDVDIDGESVDPRTLALAEDGTVQGLAFEENGTELPKLQVFTLKQVPAASLEEKTILTLARFQDFDDSLIRRITAFNRSHSNIRIVLKDYTQDGGADDIDAALTTFMADLMAGSVPDIIPLTGLPYRELAVKGILENLYPWLDQDQELKREDFFQNILDGLEVQGGLYQAVPNFSIETLAGSASIVGDTPGWNYEAFDAALARMPEDCSPLDTWYTCQDVMEALVSTNMNQFVDWTTGEVRFDSQEFRTLLAFAKRFPLETEDDDTESAQELIRAGRQMLTQAEFYSMDTLLWSDINFGGKTTYIGWPVTEGVGSVIRLEDGYAMSAKCGNKEEAWTFLREFLTEAGQASVLKIPTNRHVYEKKLGELMQVNYQKDEAGNYLLDENGERVQEPRAFWQAENGEELAIYAMTQEQADEMMTVIESCTRVSNYDTSILDIVTEQVQGYFLGQRSLDEVCRLIQSRISIYVNEQR